jgi:WD40 repeat protein
LPDTVNFFPSLRALQDAHRVLLQRYRKAGKLTGELRTDIERFLRTGGETGHILDTPSDRTAAQGLLDYWPTVLYREGEEVSESLLAPFDPSAVPQLGDVKCPYVGLRSFRKDEDSFFFGRENLTRDLLERLHVRNFVAVIGPPGSGRTSLVEAGLLAALTHDQLPGSSSWPIHERSPPFQGKMALRADELTSVTIIDDCDNIFAADSDTSPEDFAREVATFADAPGIRRIIVLVLRSDYEDRFTGLSSLEERIKQGHVRITEPTAKEIREAIERPAERVGLKFEEGVVDAIVHELVGERAAFALLQFTMIRLWEKRSNNRITWTALHQVGIGRRALVGAAQDFYDGLSLGQREVLRQVLVRLGASAQSTSVPWDVLAKASDSTDETDRVLVKLRAAPRSVAVPWDFLCKASDKPDEADRLLEAIAREGLISVAERASDKQKTVKLAHDSLLEQWYTLAGWLKQESDRLDRRLRLEAKARVWETRGRPNDALLTELETLQAKEWLKSSESLRVGASPNLRAFVDTSDRWHGRRIRRRMAGLGLVIVFLAATTLIAGLGWHKAGQERDRADQARADEHLQSELTLIGLMRQQILTTENDILSAQTFSSQLKTSASRRGSGSEAGRVAKIRDQADDLKEYRDRLLLKKDLIARTREDTIAEIAKGNLRLWSKGSEEQRERIIADVSQMITGNKFRSDDQSEPSTGSKLRMALFAIAAIPQNEPSWNDALRKLMIEYRGRRTNAPLVGQIWGLAFNPQNRNEVAFGDEVGIVRLWDPFASEPGAAVKELWSAASGIVNSVAFSPDGRLLAAAYRSAGTVIWDLQRGSVPCAFNPNTGSDEVPNVGSSTLPNVGSYSVAFSPDGSILAVAGSDRAAHLWDVRSCSELSPVFRHLDDVFGVAFDPDGRLLATASGDGTVKVWRLDQPEASIRDFPIGKAMFAVAFNPMRKTTLVAAGANGTGCILDIAGPKTSKKCLEIEIEPKDQAEATRTKTGSVGQVAFSPDGKYVVATAGNDGEAIVSDPDTGKMLYRLGGNQWGTPTQQRLFGVAFSPDSKYLLTGNLDGVARLWAVGDDEDQAVAVADRDELIRIGGERMGANAMVLPATECQTLRSKGIPIFVFADSPWERLKEELCPLPFLEPKEGGK